MGYRRRAGPRRCARGRRVAAPAASAAPGPRRVSPHHRQRPGGAGGDLVHGCRVGRGDLGGPGPVIPGQQAAVAGAPAGGRMKKPGCASGPSGGPGKPSDSTPASASPGGYATSPTPRWTGCGTPTAARSPPAAIATYSPTRSHYSNPQPTPGRSVRTRHPSTSPPVALTRRRRNSGGPGAPGRRSPAPAGRCAGVPTRRPPGSYGSGPFVHQLAFVGREGGEDAGQHPPRWGSSSACSQRNRPSPLTSALGQAAAGVNLPVGATKHRSAPSSELWRSFGVRG